jgi:hypothetical protein
LDFSYIDPGSTSILVDSVIALVISKVTTSPF